jgi:hypothetical protein
VIAGRAHRIGLLTGYATGTPFLYTRDEVLAEYGRIGGYNGKPSTDNGCDMTEAANDGVNVGYADGSKDIGWIAFNAEDKTEVMTALYLFEVADLGMCLPDAWIDPFPGADGFKWDVAGDPDFNNGHCVQLIDYTPDGGIVATWALEGLETFKALAKYGSQSASGELIIHLNQDQLDKAMQRSPDGVAWADLIAAFNSMGGNIPVPSPAPPGPGPGPAPTPPQPPSSGVTLAQADAWATAGVRSVKNLSNTMRDHISTAVRKSLAKNWPT